MQIVSFFAENLKRLRVVEIRPTGPLVQITGANGSGKSSVLDAIYFALAGKKAIDRQPVRQGEEQATVRLDLGEVVVMRKFTPDGATSVTVEAASGARFPSPQAILDNLFGDLTFDPLEFSRMDSGERSDALRKLVKLPADTETIDSENARDFERRRDVNRDVAALRPRVAALRAKLPEKNPERVDVARLVAELQKAGEFNTLVERQRTMWANEDRDLERLKDSSAGILAKIAELQREQRRLETIIEAKEEEKARRTAPERAIDTADLVLAIDAGNLANREADEVARVVSELAGLEARLRDAENVSAQLTAAMDTRTAKRREALAAAPMPIDGLSFAEDFRVLYLGLPFEQASSAEQLRVSVAIAMAMNPKLRVLRIKDGSLLDENNLALIAKMAEAGDYQIWIERVDTSGRVGVVMEDGAVKLTEG